MAKPNPARDYTNKLAEDLGFTVTSNYVYRDAREIQVEKATPAERAGFKQAQFEVLANAGFLPAYSEWHGEIKNGVLIISCRYMNDKNPHAKPPAEKAPATPTPLPESVATYITKDLGVSLNNVVAHRIVNGEETLYAVLMSNNANAANPIYWTVVFVGTYVARRPLGPYEEAYRGNAMLTGWSCLYDSGEWDYSVERFKNAPYRLFNG